MSVIQKIDKSQQAVDIIDHLDGAEQSMARSLTGMLALVEGWIDEQSLTARDTNLLIRTMVEKVKDIRDMRAVIAGDTSRATVDLERRSRDLLAAAQELVRRGQVTDITPTEIEEQ